MLAGHLAGIATPLEAIGDSRAQSERYSARTDGETKLVPVELHLSRNVDLVLAPLSQEAVAFGTEKFCGP